MREEGLFTNTPFLTLKMKVLKKLYLEENNLLHKVSIYAEDKMYRKKLLYASLYFHYIKNKTELPIPSAIDTLNRAIDKEQVLDKASRESPEKQVAQKKHM